MTDMTDLLVLLRGSVLAALQAVSVEGELTVLLLDDVFSELDEHRSRALLSELPAVQTIITSAIGVPIGTHPELVIDVGHGRAVPRVGV